MKEYLKNNPEQIEKILSYYGYHSINITDKEIRFAKIGGDNPSGCRIKLNDNLSATDFTTSYNGDLFSLIATHIGLTYGEVIKTVETMLGGKIEGNYQPEEESLFDGFFDNLYIPYESEEEEVTYDESVLDKYNNGYKWFKRFADDGILPSSQVKFNIGFSEESNRITIPWRDSEGKLIGVIARIDSDEKTNYKYLPLIAFPKHKYLYGLYQNKEYIKESKEVYVFESEKSVLLGDSLGYRNFTSLGGNSISKTQVEQLLKLGVTKIIISLDEGLDTEIIKRDIKTIKDCLFMKDNIRIGFILDKNNKYLPKGGKDSPIDLGKEVFEKLCDECLIINQ
nr:MAG TPA: DNA primase [Caudoviricetes sp.]